MTEEEEIKEREKLQKVSQAFFKEFEQLKTRHNVNLIATIDVTAMGVYPRMTLALREKKSNIIKPQ